MRILHTADWHLGRVLEGRSRHEEHEQFVNELCAIAKQEGVHLILLAGDVFDTFTPPAAAEELYFDALSRLSDDGRRAVVVVAGNHDSPDRLCAVRALAQRHGITLFGYPWDDPGTSDSTVLGADRVRRIASGPGWVELAIPGVAYTAVVLGLPYPSESRLNEVLESTLDEGVLQRAYSERLEEHLANLARQFRPDTVRLVVGHFFVGGGTETESERPIQVGGAYTVSPVAMPADAQYVALGHLHRPQQMHLAAAHTRYSGSPLSYSFSEVGYAKSVTLVDVEPAMAEPVVREIPLSAGKPLVRWRARGGMAEVERWLAEGKDANAWIDLEIHLTRSLTMDEIQKLRKAHGGIVQIRPVFVQTEEVAATAEEESESLAEQFARFYRQKRGGAAPPDELTRLFLELVTEADEGEVEA